MQRRYTDLAAHLRAVFGCRVQKITVDAGLSCPNRDGTVSTGGCIYCNPRGSGTGAHAQGLGVAQQLEMGKRAMARRYKAKKYIAYFQSFSNTYAPLGKLTSLYDEALSVEGVVGLSIGTRPDCVDDAVLDLIAGHARTHLVWLEYGLQSAHDETLKRINRGHDVSCFERAVAAARRRSIPVCAHVILGLPGEGRRRILETARFLGRVGVEGVKLHLLYVIRGTPMEALYRRGAYRPLEQGEYVDLVCDFLERLPPETVIHRLTGDPHPDELVAPPWSRKKRQTLAMIHETLARRGTRQGTLFDPSHQKGEP